MYICIPYHKCLSNEEDYILVVDGLSFFICHPLYTCLYTCISKQYVRVCKHPTSNSKSHFALKEKHNDPVFLQENFLIVLDQLIEDHGCCSGSEHISIDLLNHWSTPKILNGTVMNNKDCQTSCQLGYNDYDRFCRLTDLKVRRGEYISSKAYQWQSSQIGSRYRM